MLLVLVLVLVMLVLRLRLLVCKGVPFKEEEPLGSLMFVSRGKLLKLKTQMLRQTHLRLLRGV